MSISQKILDLVIVAMVLPFAIPIFVLTSLLVWLFMGRPIFFKQMRGGYKGKPFPLYKFRTMTDERNAAGELLPDSQRLTKLGRFLRASSLDELPSLLNFIRGEIRLVGPRPFMAQYLPLYTAEQMRRHDVVPGVTGWAQVNGRNALAWEEKFALDLWYVDNRSFALDLRILWLTVVKVVRRDGVNSDAETTMPIFEGPTEK